MEAEEEEKDIKIHVEEVCHKGALEQLAFEEGDKLTQEGWKENIQREKRRSSNGVQEKVILDGDRQERKDDEGISVEEERWFSEFKTEGKQGNRGDDLNPTVEMEGGPVKEEEDAKEGPERNNEEVKPTLIHWDNIDGRETEERPTTRLDNKEPEGLNVQEENLEMKEIADKWIELHSPSLDFTAQKSRISLKNAHSRPPRNPRALLHKQSLLPTPSKLQQSRQLKIVPMAVKQGGPIIKGFKLPGIGGEFPSLKKTDRGVREKEEGFTAEAPDATKMLTSERQDVVGGKAVAMGGIGVKLPGFSAEFPGLRKTERGVKMREQAPENTTSHDNSSERHDSTGTDSIKGITVPAFKLTGFSSGFPALRKTNRGVKIREGEDTQSYTQNSEVEASATVVDLPKAKSKWTPPGKPGIGIGNPSMMSELKNKLRKTE
ncbi:hypothetical protein COCON_G00031170 [Conger conger]|uniref:Uncharacterized protein n=1 Tax=Conger conger TaxID=82655 RepID=A0A9Q1DYT4_CONCO|nr:hypothetical protein COCON_G00031170 [Conger conger]